jgi:hypothetical protein
VLDGLLIESVENVWRETCKVSGEEMKETDLQKDERNSDKATLPTTSLIKVWSLGLKELLLTEKGREYFEAFSKTDECLNSFNFLKDFEYVKTNVFDRKEYLEKVKDICSKYIYNGGLCPVSSIDNKLQRKVVEIVQNSTFETLPVDILDKVYENIYQQIEKDAYQRFIKSDIIKSILLRHSNVKRRESTATNKT